MGEEPAVLECLLVRNPDDLIIDAGIENLGDEACANALILCGPGFSPERTALVSGSTAMTFTLGFLDFRNLPAPVRVPPVPTPATKKSTWPSVSSQILRAGGGEMSLNVGRVLELSEDY